MDGRRIYYGCHNNSQHGLHHQASDAAHPLALQMLPLLPFPPGLGPKPPPPDAAAGTSPRANQQPSGTGADATATPRPLPPAPPTPQHPPPHEWCPEELVAQLQVLEQLLESDAEHHQAEKERCDCSLLAMVALR